MNLLQQLQAYAMQWNVKKKLYMYGQIPNEVSICNFLNTFHELFSKVLIKYLLISLKPFAILATSIVIVSDGGALYWIKQQGFLPLGRQIAPSLEFRV